MRRQSENLGPHAITLASSRAFIDSMVVNVALPALLHHNPRIILSLLRLESFRDASALVLSFLRTYRSVSWCWRRFRWPHTMLVPYERNGLYQSSATVRNNSALARSRSGGQISALRSQTARLLGGLERAFDIRQPLLQERERATDRHVSNNGSLRAGKARLLRAQSLN